MNTTHPFIRTGVTLDIGTGGVNVGSFCIPLRVHAVLLSILTGARGLGREGTREKYVNELH